MINQEFDVIIVGGGLVGRVSAIAFAQRGLQVAIIEANPPSLQLQTDYDTRSIALSYGSVQILDKLDLWQLIAKKVTEIHQVHISDQGQFGFTRIHGKDYQLPALGYVIEMPHLIKILVASQQQSENITLLAPVTFESMERIDGKWQITIKHDDVEKKLSCSLTIAADGVKSSIRNMLGIDVSHHDYQKKAIVSNVGLSRCHDGIAYERFTRTGPVALLPIADDRYALIWTVEQSEELLSLSDDDFLKKLQKHFGYRAGRFVRVGKRLSYPLTSIRSKQQTSPGVILMGNAAHNLAPFAAQGFNLSLRDVATLMEQFDKHYHSGEINPCFFDHYEKARKTDQRVTFYFTHSLATVFNPRFIPTRFLRNVAMVSLDRLLFMKRLLAWQAMGL